jgi:hypothetical protein
LNEFLKRAANVIEQFESHSAGGKVRAVGEVPQSFDALTNEWLSAVLCKNVPGACVTDYALGPRDDGTSNRRRITVTYNAAGRAAGLPEKLFGKSTEQLQSRLLLGPSGAAAAEVNFYNIVQPVAGINSTAALYAGFDEKLCHYMIIMPDIGDTVYFCDIEDIFTIEQAKAQMDTLANLHSKYYMHKDLATPRLPFAPWSDFWDGSLEALPDWPDCSIKAVEDFSYLFPEGVYGRREEIWPLTIKACDSHRALPRTLVHSDTHQRNWFILPSGQMGLHDWQSITVGHWSRDVAYCLSTGLTVENRRKWEVEILQHYVQKMTSLGVPMPDEAEAWVLVRQQMFSALAFWTITLVPGASMPEEMQPLNVCETFVERMAAAIDDHKAFDSF